MVDCEDAWIFSRFIRDAGGPQGDPRPGYPCFGGPVFDSPGFHDGWSPGNTPRELTFLPLVNQSFVIPPAPSGARSRLASRFRRSCARIHAVPPHMHLLGRDIAMDVDFPDGRTQRIVRIDDWDFDWQDTYWLKEPLLVPSRATGRFTCVYDNSETNPANPNRPPKGVRWSERTVDEMALIFVAVTLE